MYRKSVFYVCLIIWFSKSKGQNDYFVTKKYNVKSVYCVTNSSSALSWVKEPIKETLYSGSRSQFIPSTSNNNFDCTIEKNDRNTFDFIKPPWMVKNSLEANFNKVVLDERWEEINIEMTEETRQKKSKLLKYIPVLEINNTNFEIPLSIRIKQEAHIFLCDGENPPHSNCYWLMLQAWSGDTTALRKCSVEDIPSEKEKYPQKKSCKDPKLSIKHPTVPRYLFANKWSHFKLKKEENKITFTQIKRHASEEIFNWEDKEENINVKHMIIHSKTDKGLWKIHEVTYMYTNEETNDVQLGTLIESYDKNSICLSMYISMCTSCKIKLTLNQEGSTPNDNSKMFFSEDSGWFQIRFISKNINTKSRRRFFVSTIGSDSGRYWAIDKVRLCQENEFRKIGLAEDAPCQLMSDEKTISTNSQILLSDSTCPENTIGKFCVPCEWIYQECKQIKICTEENECTCSAGYRNYEGYDCYYNCEYGTYGHGCRKKCGNCYYGRNNCDRIDGTCDRNQCEINYSGPKCDKRSTVTFLQTPSVSSITYTSATVTITNFTVENNLNVEITGYLFQYKEADNRINNWKNTDLLYFNQITPTTISDLKPDTKYFVRAVIKSSDGKIYSDYIEKYTDFTTKCEDVTKNQVDITPSNTSATVLIQRTENTCKLTKYSVNVDDIGRGNILNESAIIFDKLKPFTHYTLNLIISDKVNIEKKIQTTEGVPNEVRDLLVYSKNESSVSLKWKPPYPPTGILNEYKIIYKFYNYYKLKTDTLNTKITKCHLWPEFHCAHVTKLVYNKQYTFEIVGKNLEPNDFGTKKSIEAVTITEKSEPPYDLKMKWTTKNDLELEWKHPNVTNGEIEYFNVRLFTRDLDFAQNLPINNYNLIYHFKINSKEIRPTTDYRLQIAACNKKYTGNFLIRNNTSPPDIPQLDDLQTESSNKTILVKIVPKKLRGKTDLSQLMLFISEKTTNAKLENNVVTGLDNFRLVSNCTSNTTSFKPLTIGNSQQWTQCSGIDNPPLKPGTHYNISVVLINFFGQTNRTNLFTISTTTTGTPIYSGPNLNLLALLVLLFIIPLIIILYIKRQAILKPGEKTNQVPDVKDDQIPLTGLKPESSEKRNPEIEVKIHSKCIKITEFEAYVKKSIQSGELERQHALFPRGQTNPWNYGSLKKNKSKNRHNNLIAYDHSRIILEKINGDSHSDYINASYIDGHKIPKAYIATQNPKAATVDDFWRMIWEKNVMHIANLANVYEGGKKKVEKYWPDINETLKFGPISVQHLSTQVFADYEHRTFSISQNNEIRKVDQLHFMSWPDHGVPLYSQSLVPFLQKLLKIPLSTTSPIVVHCSAGVGATGTILLCDISLRMAAREGSIDVLGNLEHMRHQRANMVDNIKQYKLAHLVILECLVGMHTSINCSEIKDSVNRILTNGTTTLQLRYLKDTQWQDQAMKTVGQTDEEVPIIEEKNRFKKIIPEIQGRVFLSRFPSNDDTSSYINAVKVDGFRSPGRFIVTQQPMPNTVGDFWRLIDENNISVILSLNEVNFEEKTSCRFWPTRSHPEMTPVPHITLKYINITLFESCDITIVRLIANSRIDHLSVQIISVKHWPPGNHCPDNIGHFLTFWEESNAIIRTSNPVLVTCFDGVTASGLYVALSFVIEKMKLEQVCDVCQAVRSVRHNREQFVQNVEQFEFLYKAALLYFDKFQEYAVIADYVNFN